MILLKSYITYRVTSSGGVGGEGVWGQITGNIADQTDLQQTLQTAESNANDYTDQEITALQAGVPSAGDNLSKLYNLISDLGTLVGGWNSSSLPTTGSDPTGSINKGDYWKITGTVTIAGIGDLKAGDSLVASIANASVAADFFALQNNVDLATPTVLGLVKLYTDLLASNTDGSVSQAALVTAFALKANLNSPALTGTPTAPTAATDINTAQIATTAHVKDVLKLNTVGTIISETWANLTNWTDVGSGTFSVASNILTVNGGTPATPTVTNYRRQSAYGFSNTEDFKISFTQTIGTLSATSHGIAIGLQRQNGVGGVSIAAALILNTGSDRGKISWFYDNSGTAVKTSTGSMTVTAGDVLNITFTRNKGRFTYEVFNTTTNRGISEYYEFLYAYPATTLPPSSFNFAIYALGGTHTIASGFNVVSNVIKDADLMILSDSKQTGYYLISTKNRVSELINRNFNARVVVNGGPGNYAEGFNASEVLAATPKKIIIMAGYNNNGLGDTGAQLVAKIDTLIASLTGYTLGVNLFVGTLEASSAINVTSYNTSIVTAYGSSVLDFYPSTWSGTGTSLKTIYDGGDGVHLNQLWAKLQTQMISDFFGFKGRSQTDSDGGLDKAVLFTDNGITSEALNLSWDKSTRTLRMSENDVDGLTNLTFYNAAAGGTTKEGSIRLCGTTAFGITPFRSALLIQGVAQGGINLNGYVGPVIISTTSLGVTRIQVTNGGLIAIGTQTPTSRLHLPAGAAGASQNPLKFTSGTNNTTAENGAMEYNGTNLFFTRAGAVREGVLTQSAVTTEAIVSDTSVTVNIGGTTYKLLARA